MDGSMGSITEDALPKAAMPQWRGASLLRPHATARAASALTVAAMAAGLLAAAPASADIVRDGGAGIGILRPLPVAGTPIHLPSTIASIDVTEPAVAAREPKVTVYRADAPQNFEVNLRLNPASDEAQGDVALRLSSPRDYYAVRIDSRAERVVFLRVSDGRAEEVASADRRVATNAWHSLRVRAEDNRFTVTLDGEWLFTAYDTALREAGRLAVWTAPGSPVRFDAIAVSPLPPE